MRVAARDSSLVGAPRRPGAAGQNPRPAQLCVIKVASPYVLISRSTCSADTAAGPDPDRGLEAAGLSEIICDQAAQTRKRGAKGTSICLVGQRPAYRCCNELPCM